MYTEWRRSHPTHAVVFVIKTLLHHTIYCERVWDREKIWSLGNWSHFVWQVMCWRFDRNRASITRMRFKGAIHSQLNWAILLCYVIPGEHWVNCAVLTSNSAGLRTVLSSRFSHRELRSSLRESHSFLSLPADTTMASSQGTSVSSNSFNRWTSDDIFLFKYHILLHILNSLFFFSDNIMADVASKQQTTALFYPP
jgi:hypothetical protein